MLARLAFISFVAFLGAPALPQQITAQDLDKVLERADALLEEAKTAYEGAREKSSVPGFIDAGFKLEEARIKYIVLQEIGAPEKQKVAADRLRAVNQLSKLIHDGKVAITGTPADSPSPAPKPAEPSATPKPAEPAAPPPPAVDVTKRAAIPDAAKQKEAEKLVKDLFKDQYAKKTPADRKALARLLLNQAAKSADDPAAYWVLCREAQDVAVQVCDVPVAIDAIEWASRAFDLDALALKNTALAAAAKFAKAPEEFIALAEALFRLIDELVAADQFDAADKAAAAALAHAKRSNDSGLATRAATRAKETAEAKSLYTSMKSVLETLAKNPNDASANLEVGRFLCFVKGSWDLGLRFIVKGSDAALKGLAEKELAAPVQGAEKAALADGWWELMEKEKSPLRKSRLLAHAKALYESALPDAPALVRAKIEKRLEVLNQGPPLGANIDLLKLVDPRTDRVAGEWMWEGSALSSPAGAQSGRLMVPLIAPDEYDLVLTVERKEGNDGFGIGLANGNFQTVVMLDGYSVSGYVSGFEVLDGKMANTNEAARPGPVFGKKPANIQCSVRKDRLSVTVDGKKVIDWKGDQKRLSVRGDYVVPNARAIFFTTYETRYVISKAMLNTVSGQGKRLR